MNKVKSVVVAALTLAMGFVGASAFASAGDVININVFQDGTAISQDQQTLASKEVKIPSSAWLTIGKPGGGTASVTGSKAFNITSGSEVALPNSVTATVYSMQGSNWAYWNKSDTPTVDPLYAYMTCWASNRDRSCIPGWFKIEKIPFSSYDVILYFQGGTDQATAEDYGHPKVEGVTPTGFDPIRVTSGNASFTASHYYAPGEDGILSVEGDTGLSANSEDKNNDVIKLSSMWGTRCQPTAAFGVNAIKIENCTGTFEIHYWARTSAIAAAQVVDKSVPPVEISVDASNVGGLVKTSDINYHPDLEGVDPSRSVTVTMENTTTFEFDELFAFAGLKVILDGDLLLKGASEPSDFEKYDFSGVTGKVTYGWLPEKGCLVAINFDSGAGKLGDEEPCGIAGIEAPGKGWNNTTAVTGSLKAKIYNSSLGAMLPNATISATWAAKEFWSYGTGVQQGYLKGYLDDGAHDGVDGATITLSNIPFETYDLYVICATDTGSTSFRPVTVNGTSYYAGSDGLATSGTSNWGHTQKPTPILGENVIRFSGLTDTTLKIQGGNKSGARGGIAAIILLGPVDEPARATIWGDTDWSGIDWEEGRAPEMGTPVELTIAGNATLTIEEGELEFAVGKISLLGGANEEGEPFAFTIADNGGLGCASIDSSSFEGAATLASARAFNVAFGATGFTYEYDGEDELESETISGSGTFVKTGSGTLLVNFGQSFAGAITVAEGTLKAQEGATYAFGNTTAITVRQDATLDYNGMIGNVQPSITLDGGILKNSRVNIATSQMMIHSITLTADSTIDAETNFGSVSRGYNEAFIDLGGFTLTKTGAGTYYLIHTTVSGEGKISVAEGTLMSGDQSNGSEMGEDATLEIAGGALDLNKPLTVGTLKLVGTEEGVSMTGTAELTILKGLSFESEYDLTYARGLSGEIAVEQRGKGKLTIAGDTSHYTGTLTIYGDPIAGALVALPADFKGLYNVQCTFHPDKLPIPGKIDPNSYGMIQLPESFVFGEIGFLADGQPAVPAGIGILDSEGEDVTDRIEIRDANVMYLPLEAITKVMEVAKRMDVGNQPLAFDSTGGAAFKNPIPNLGAGEAMLTTTGDCLILAGEPTISIEFFGQYPVGTKFALMAANAMPEGFAFVKKLPIGTEGDFSIEGNTVVFTVTKSLYADMKDLLGEAKLHFDAALPETVEFADGSAEKVYGWANLGTAGGAAQCVDMENPFYSTAEKRPCLDFGTTWSGRDLVFERANDLVTVIEVIDIEQDYYAWLLGDLDTAAQGEGTTNFSRGANGEYGDAESAKFHEVWCNGESVSWSNDVIRTGFRVITMEMSESSCADCFAEGLGGRKLYELMAFNRTLTIEERKAIEDYLVAKWHLLNVGEVAGEESWSEIKWKLGDYEEDAPSKVTAVEDATLTFDEAVKNQEIVLDKREGVTFNLVVTSETDFTPTMSIPSGTTLTVEGNEMPDDPFVYTGLVTVQEGGTLVANGFIDFVQGIAGDGLVVIENGGFNIGESRSLAFKFLDASAELAVTESIKDDGVAFIRLAEGSVVPKVVLTDGTGAIREAKVDVVSGGIRISYDTDVSGKVCLYDWTFDNGEDKGNGLKSVGQYENELTWDNNHSAADGFVEDPSFTYGTALKTLTTPYFPDNANILYPDEWTCMVAGIVPNQNEGAFITFGTKNAGWIGLIAGTSENEVLVVYCLGQGVPRPVAEYHYKVLSTMTVPNARKASHCYLFVKTADNHVKVYLDGTYWNENTAEGIAFGPKLQIGSIHGNPANSGVVQVKDVEGTSIQAVRIFEGVLGNNAIRTLANEFPYHSENEFAREFTAAEETWVEADAWTKTSTGETAEIPDDGAALDISIADGVETVVTVDLPNAQSYENISFSTSPYTPGSLTLKPGEGGIVAENAGQTEIDAPVTIEYGAMSISGGPTTITDNGHITFDYTDYPVAMVYETTTIPLTGIVLERDDSKVTIKLPAAVGKRTVSGGYDETLKRYCMTIDVQAHQLTVKEGTTFVTNDTVFTDEDGQDALHESPNDVLIIPYGVETAVDSAITIPFASEIRGAGTLVCDGARPTGWSFAGEDWTGTVWIKNVPSETDTFVGGWNFGSYRNANSKVRITNVQGWLALNVNQGSLELEDGPNGEAALNVVDSSGGYSYAFDALTGSGTFNYSTKANSTCQAFIKDVSEFTGALTSKASTHPTDGSATTGRPIYIADAAVEGGATMESKITVADGKTIRSGCGWEAEHAAFGATLNIIGQDGDIVIAGLVEEPTELPETITLNGEQVEGLKLVYEAGTLRVAVPQKASGTMIFLR